MWDISAPSRSDCRPLYLQLAEGLIEHIRVRGVAPGTLMPSEAELMQRYGLSRITVRQTMLKLCADGWANKVQGKGTFVAEPPASSPLKAWTLPDGTLWYEPAGIEDSLVEAIEYPPSPKYRELLALPENTGTYRVRRVKLLGGVVVGVETRHFPPFVRVLFSQEELAAGVYESMLSRHANTAPGRVRYSIRSTLVSEPESALLGISSDSHVLNVGTVYYNRDAVPVMSGRVVYITDNFELSYDVRFDQ
jgi:Transcriptional regulators